MSVRCFISYLTHVVHRDACKKNWVDAYLTKPGHSQLTVNVTEFSRLTTTLILFSLIACDFYNWTVDAQRLVTSSISWLKDNQSSTILMTDGLFWSFYQLKISNICCFLCRNVKIRSSSLWFIRINEDSLGFWTVVGQRKWCRKLQIFDIFAWQNDQNNQSVIKIEWLDDWLSISLWMKWLIVVLLQFNYRMSVWVLINYLFDML